MHLGTVLVAPGLLVLFAIARPNYFKTGKFWASAALLGGLTSITGAFVGGVAIGLVESEVSAHSTTAGAPEVAIFIVLLIALLARPQGIFGGSEA